MIRSPRRTCYPPVLPVADPSGFGKRLFHMASTSAAPMNTPPASAATPVPSQAGRSAPHFFAFGQQVRQLTGMKYGCQTGSPARVGVRTTSGIHSGISCHSTEDDRIPIQPRLILVFRRAAQLAVPHAAGCSHSPPAHVIQQLPKRRDDNPAPDPCGSTVSTSCGGGCPRRAVQVGYCRASE